MLKVQIRMLQSPRNFSIQKHEHTDKEQHMIPTRSNSCSHSTNKTIILGKIGMIKSPKVPKHMAKILIRRVIPWKKTNESYTLTI